jgi:hypothetical protein
VPTWRVRNCRQLRGFAAARQLQFADWTAVCRYVDEVCEGREAVMEILKLDESCSSNPKSEIANWTGSKSGDGPGAVQF